MSGRGDAKFLHSLVCVIFFGELMTSISGNITGNPWKSLWNVTTKIGNSAFEAGLRKQIVATALLQTIAVVCTLATPFFLTRTFSSLVSDNQNNIQTNHTIINITNESILELCYFALVILGSTLSSSAGRLLTTSIKQEVGVKINSELLEKFSKLDLDYTLTSPVGSFVQQVLQVLELQEATSLLLDEFYPSVLQFALLDTALLSFDWRLGLTSLGAQLISGSMAFYGTQSIENLHARQKLNSLKAFGGMIRRIQNHENIRLMGQVENELNAGIKDLSQLAHEGIPLARLPEKNALAQGIFGVLSSSGLVGLGIHELQNNRLTFEYFGALLVYSLQLNSLLSRFSRSLCQLLICHSGWEDTKKFLSMPCKFPPPINPINFTISENPASPHAASIRFNEVSFRYEQDLVLDKVSFDIKPGSKIAVIGLSGVGKSTLARLLLGFYRPESGAIHIANQDIANVKQSTLCTVIGLVPQQPKFAAGTLADVIRYAKPSITDDEIIEILKQVCLQDFATPENIKKSVGQGGLKLSGGQMQRVAIAQALLRKPYILLLDESLSAQDARHATELKQMLNETTADLTTITITHQLSHTTDADHIIVLDGGKIVQQGTFDQLKAMREGTFYKLLVKHCQLSGLQVEDLRQTTRRRAIPPQIKEYRQFVDESENVETAHILNMVNMPGTATERVPLLPQQTLQ